MNRRKHLRQFNHAFNASSPDELRAFYETSEATLREHPHDHRLLALTGILAATLAVDDFERGKAEQAAALCDLAIQRLTAVKSETILSDKHSRLWSSYTSFIRFFVAPTQANYDHAIGAFENQLQHDHDADTPESWVKNVLLVLREESRQIAGRYFPHPARLPKIMLDQVRPAACKRAMMLLASLHA